MEEAAFNQTFVPSASVNWYFLPLGVLMVLITATVFVSIIIQYLSVLLFYLGAGLLGDQSVFAAIQDDLFSV